jgi:hypothetical protein
VDLLPPLQEDCEFEVSLHYIVILSQKIKKEKKEGKEGREEGREGGRKGGNE